MVLEDMRVSVLNGMSTCTTTTPLYLDKHLNGQCHHFSFRSISVSMNVTRSLVSSARLLNDRYTHFSSRARR